MVSGCNLKVTAVLMGAAAAGFGAWHFLVGAIGDLSAPEARHVADVLAEGFGGHGAELYEPVLKRPDPGGWLICGWVRLGGAAEALGLQPFVGLMHLDGEFVLVRRGVGELEVAAVKDVCRHRGMYL